MEYAVPRDAGLEVLAECRRVFERSGLRVSFPVEIRVAPSDDVPMSTAYDRESFYLAFHTHRDADHVRYFAVMEGIQYWRAAVVLVAVSYTVPAWLRVGVVPRLVMSYQREAMRGWVVPGTPLVVTRRLWADHRCPLRMDAANRRSSSESRRPLLPPVLPWCSTGLVAPVVGTLTRTLPEMDGVALPGLLTRRNVMRLN